MNFINIIYGKQKFNLITKITIFNQYRRKRPKVDASISDSALSHTRRSNASKKEKKILASTFGRFRLWTSFESSPVSVKAFNLRDNFQNSGNLISRHLKIIFGRPIKIYISLLISR